MDEARFWRILARALRMIVRAIDERRLAPSALQDVVERRGYHFALSAAEDSDSRERLYPRQTAGHIVFEQSLVKPER